MPTFKTKLKSEPHLDFNSLCHLSLEVHLLPICVISRGPIVYQRTKKLGVEFHVAPADLRHTMLPCYLECLPFLPLPPKNWDYRHVPPRVSCTLASTQPTKPHHQPCIIDTKQLSSHVDRLGILEVRAFLKQQWLEATGLTTGQAVTPFLPPHSGDQLSWVLSRTYVISEERTERAFGPQNSLGWG